MPHRAAGESTVLFQVTVKATASTPAPQAGEHRSPNELPPGKSGSPHTDQSRHCFKTAPPPRRATTVLKQQLRVSRNPLLNIRRDGCRLFGCV
ncbi:hypothetical protein MRX96_039802 [Rhipicephalus microplus]